MTHHRAASTPSYAPAPTVRPLRIFRVTRGLSQQELGRLAGVNRSTVSRLEAGLEEPLPRTKVALASALEFDVEVIFPARSGE